MSTILSASSTYSAKSKNWHLPGSKFLLVKNYHSEAVSISDNYGFAIGYQNPIDFLGLTDHSIRSPLAKLADQFGAQDRLILKTRSVHVCLLLSSYHGRPLSVFISAKFPSGDEVVCNVWPLTYGPIFDQFQTMIKRIDIKYHAHISQCFDVIEVYGMLSTRESEVMYFLMFSKSAADIALMLNLSKRTVQHYIEHIRIKMDCQSVAELIELGMCLKFHESIPASLVNVSLDFFDLLRSCAQADGKPIIYDQWGKHISTKP